MTNQLASWLSMPTMSSMPPSIRSALSPDSAVRLQAIQKQPRGLRKGAAAWLGKRLHRVGLPCWNASAQSAPPTSHQFLNPPYPLESNPTHILTTSATGCTKILPSPISPVWAAVATSRTTLSTWPLQQTCTVKPQTLY